MAVFTERVPLADLDHHVDAAARVVERYGAHRPDQNSVLADGGPALDPRRPIEVHSQRVALFPGPAQPPESKDQPRRDDSRRDDEQPHAKLQLPFGHSRSLTSKPSPAIVRPPARGRTGTRAGRPPRISRWASRRR